MKNKLPEKKNTVKKSFARYNLPILAAGILIILFVLLKNFIGSNPGTGKVDIYFKPETINLSEGTSKNISLVLDSHGKKISFTRVAIKFDQTNMQLTTDIITNPNLSTVVAKTGMADANVQGKALLVVAASPSDIPPSGVFELANFMVKTNPDREIANESTTITIDNNDSQIVNSDAQEMLIGNGSAQIIL